jgi:hypothetical protein
MRMANNVPSHIRITPMPLRQKVLFLRRNGHDAAEISDILDISVRTAEGIIDRAIKASIDEHRIKVVREEELSKLDQIEEAFLPAATSSEEPSTAAADTVMKVMDRRMKLTGSEIKPDQHVKLEQNVTLVSVLADMSNLPPKEPSPQKVIEGTAE